MEKLIYLSELCFGLINLTI